MAEAAFKESDGKAGYVMDTYARALFDDGQLSKALKMQKKAIQHAKDKGERKLMEAHLEQFRNGVQ